MRKTAVEKLLRWYEKNKRAFPWRADPSPYCVWIAEIMSQQTQMNSLLPYYERFMRAFPSVKDLAAASEEEVLKAWAGLGYYSRAKNLHKGARKITELGQFPQGYEQWLEIPGVGPYTAAAVVSQSFEVPRAVWDGNVLRVTSRFFAEAKPYVAAFKTKTLLNLEKSMEGFSPSAFNQALMELGALVCTPKNPKCGKCPLEGSCVARGKKLQSELPPPKPRKPRVEVTAGVFVFLKKKGNALHVLMKERSNGNWYSGLWDFPSELGGVQKPEVALPEFKVITFEAVLKRVPHSITNHKIALIPHVLLESSIWKTKLEGRAKGCKWVSIAEAFGETPVYPIATTARKVMRAVCEYLGTENEGNHV